MDTLRILSIDMDFFQDVDAVTMTECYPDGHDFSGSLATLIWSFHYSDPYERDKLLGVKCPEIMLSKLKGILQNQDSDVPVVIAQSHLDIYTFIHSESASHNCENIDITNIDMHHDMFTDNLDVVDCGNWIHAIRDEFSSTITWISNPISKSIMDCESAECIQVIENDFESILNKQFDAIFLCRSDIWYPPHLDSKFDELVSVIRDKFNNVKIDTRLSDRQSAVQVDNLFDTLMKAQ